MQESLKNTEEKVENKEPVSNEQATQMLKDILSPFLKKREPPTNEQRMARLNGEVEKLKVEGIELNVDADVIDQQTVRFLEQAKTYSHEALALLGLAYSMDFANVCLKYSRIKDATIGHKEEVAALNARIDALMANHGAAGAVEAGGPVSDGPYNAGTYSKASVLN